MTVKNKHIIFIENPSPSSGGIQNMAYWIACELSARNFDVVLIGDPTKIPSNLKKRDNVEVHRCDAIRTKYFSDFNTGVLLLKLRYKYGKNVVLYAMLINHVKMLRLLKLFSSWTCLGFLHGNEVLRLIAQRPKTFAKNVNSCNRVFVNSNYTKSVALSAGPFDNLVLLHPGINPDDYADDRFIDLRTANNWNDLKIIFMLSRLIARKGHSVVIKALGRIIDKYPQVLLLIGGSGPYRNLIETQVRLAGLGNHVVFLGIVPENEKVSYYKCCDVYCMPSDISEDSFDVEGFGITFIEAAAAGTLAIGSNTGGIPDAVEDGKSGFLIEPNDDIKLSELLDKIFSDPSSYDQMRVYARKRALSMFSWTNQIDKIISVVEQENLH